LKTKERSEKLKRKEGKEIERLLKKERIKGRKKNLNNQKEAGKREVLDLNNSNNKKDQKMAASYLDQHLDNKKQLLKKKRKLMKVPAQVEEDLCSLTAIKARRHKKQMKHNSVELTWAKERRRNRNKKLDSHKNNKKAVALDSEIQPLLQSKRKLPLEEQPHKAMSISTKENLLLAEKLKIARKLKRKKKAVMAGILLAKDDN
jgi:hypothetical protein